MSDSPVFPPLLTGAQAEDPFAQACAEARQGCDAGLVLYNLGPSVLQAAIVFAPEVPLAQAMAMLPLCAVGFQNALGALAPPEVAVVHRLLTSGSSSSPSVQGTPSPPAPRS